MSDAPTVSDEEKQIARHLEASFGRRPNVLIYRDDSAPDYALAIAQAPDTPEPGLCTCATIGLSNHPLYDDDGKLFEATRLELIGTCRNEQADEFCKMLFLSARTVVQQKWFCSPKVFLWTAVSQFGDFGDMRHLYFTPDFSSEAFDTRQFGTRTVSWLTALPVSDAEIELAQRESVTAMEEKLAEANFDWSNIARRSVL